MLDCQYIKKLHLFATILFSLIVSTSCAQFDVDSTFTIKSNPFFRDLASREGKVYTVSINSDFSGVSLTSPILGSLGFELLKLRGRNLYLHFFRSGKIYQLDTTLTTEQELYFKRIDATWNYNYNIGSNLFTVGNEIYEIGGYGFWKSNGILRKFNFKDREWDVILLNKEIFPQNIGQAGTVTWIDSAEQYFYVPFQRITNDGLTDQGVGKDFIYEANRLHISKNTWEYLGKTNQEVFDLLKNASNLFSSPSGILLCNTSKVYYLDYTNNRVSLYENPSLAQTLSRLNNSFASYYYKDWVYWYNYSNARYDSVYINRAKFMPIAAPIWEKNWSMFQLVGAGLFLFLLIGGLFWWWIRKSSFSKQREGKEGFSSSMHSHPFNETELSLLLLLAGKTKKGLTATIAEINYVLGIKDKNPGMQKKVRSDVLNSVNEKFKLLHRGQGQLIQSVRSESDKRYFEYLVNAELLPELQKLIG